MRMAIEQEERKYGDEHLLLLNVLDTMAYIKGMHYSSKRALELGIIIGADSKEWVEGLVDGYSACLEAIESCVSQYSKGQHESGGLIHPQEPKQEPVPAMTIVEKKRVRMQLLIKPTLVDWLKDESKKAGKSMNEIVNQLLEAAYFGGEIGHGQQE